MVLARIVAGSLHHELPESQRRGAVLGPFFFFLFSWGRDLLEQAGLWLPSAGITGEPPCWAEVDFEEA